MKKFVSLLLFLVSFVQFNLVRAQVIAGFDTASSVRQKAFEKGFDDLLRSENIGNSIRELAAIPHHIGSPGGEAVVKLLEKRFKEYGFEVKVDTYQVLFPTPVTRVLEVTSPKKFTALLKEPVLAADASSGQKGQLPTYNCWSADGDVTAEVVYVNYGLPEDYERLEMMGIDVKGKIALARYGRSWRGIKPKVAQEHGAIGCIIYSDPREDGYFQGDVYPQGAFKNEYGVQRGSVMDMVIYPGDPLTPGIGATAGATRLERSAATNLLKIPVLPISYHDALPILSALEGPVVPEDWRGALPITYHTGPGKATVHLKLAFNWTLRPAYNVIAKLPGERFPDEWVIRGNHHDAWVNGAGDPVSGLAAMLEEARGIGEMVKKGFRPQRTVVFCAWDGEEPGLLGSTEWVEDHASELQQKAVVYINSDGNGRGFFDAGGSHALEPLTTDIATELKDPQTGVSLLDRKKAVAVIRATTAKAQKDLMDRKGFALGALGSGSDYSSFLQHLGIPSLNIGFGGEDPGGEYHSIYDSYDDYRRFKDSGFVYGKALAQTAGRYTLRMANAGVLPFDFRSLHKTISSYVTDLLSFTEQYREATAVSNQVIRSKRYDIGNDPTKRLKAPKVKAEVPFLDFSPVQNALVLLEKSTGGLAERLAKEKPGSARAAAINKSLYQAEQQLLEPAGLPRRGWYKHTIYAPGFYTGYGVKTLPGLREAIEQREWQEAQQQVSVLAASISRLAAFLDGVAK